MSIICKSCGHANSDELIKCEKCGEMLEIADDDVKKYDLKSNDGIEEESETPTDSKSAKSATITMPPVRGKRRRVNEDPYEEQLKGYYSVCKEVSTSFFFWSSLLFAVPVAGVIAAIVYYFAYKNPSIKNFAKSFLIWVLVFAVIAALLLLGIIVMTFVNENLSLGKIFTPEFWTELFTFIGLQ